MQKEQIREQFSLLEEQLERLLSISSPSFLGQKNIPVDAGEEDLLVAKVKNVFDELHLMVHEETLRQKSVSSTDFIQKIIKILIQEASAREYKIAVSYCAKGRISIEMVELSMNSILACLKASLESFAKMYAIERAKRNLFQTYSIHLEVNGRPDEIHFRLLDDGLGYERGDDDIIFDDQFDRIRKNLAKVGGWFSRVSLKKYGGQIQFKLPLPRNRPEVVLVKKGDFEVLIPCFCIVETSNEIQEILADGKFFIGELDAISGIRKLGSKTDSKVAIKVGVADFELWILCDSVSAPIKSRKYNAKEFLAEASWYSYFGLCQIGNTGVALPLLDGNSLMRFYSGSSLNENRQI